MIEERKLPSAITRASCLSHWIVLPLLLLVSGTTAQAEERLWLTRNGEPGATLIGGGQDEYAVERLQRWFAERANVALRTAPADPARIPAAGTVILLGSAASNPMVAQLSQVLGLNLDPSDLTEQGYVARRLEHEGRQWLILAGGGRDGVIHAVADLMNLHLNAADGDVWVGALNTRQVPCLKYRWFWNWDNRMEWGGGGSVVLVPASVEGGSVSTKSTAAFLTDCKRCIDYMADHKFNGLILWGLLRDSHGGLEAAQEVCRYAARRGVRILPGVGTSGYNGYYYEGKNRFNIDHWLAQHPHLRAVKEDGAPYAALCPSKPANIRWLDDGAEWLFENLEIGGVNLEMGDFLVCYCQGCRQARAAIESSEPDYYKDMALSHSATLEKMRRLAPHAWLSYATYTGYTKLMETAPPAFLSMIPDSSICQWTLTGMARNWPADVCPTAKHNIRYLHWTNRSTQTENDFYLQRIHDICRKAAAAGLEGIDTYGELGADRLNVELAYLAWEAFLWQPEMTMDQFAQRYLGRLYGGAAAARELARLVPTIRTRNLRSDASNMAQAIRMAQAARELSTPSGLQRWDKLIANLQRTHDALQERYEGPMARAGRKIPVLSVTASDEDEKRRYLAQNAIDSRIDEPKDCWLTQAITPEKANQPRTEWLELRLAKPTKINRVAIFHQIDRRYSRALDYAVSIRRDGKWKPVVTVKDNAHIGWVGHAFDEVTTSAIRLVITRATHWQRMGLGEIEILMSQEK